MKVCVVGGRGKVGAAFAEALAPHHDVSIYDIVGADDPWHVGVADVVVVAVPETALPEALVDLPLRHEQLVIIRSTLVPGQFSAIEGRIPCPAAVCPERALEGRQEEVTELPQIVGVRSDAAYLRVVETLSPLLKGGFIRVAPEEAELAKLYCNAYRYLKFAAANTFFMLADSRGLDYNSIHRAVTEGYPRAADLPQPGMVGGPCLPKDAHTLDVTEREPWGLPGLMSAAITVNNSLPQYLLRKLGDINGKTLGILGMAFKPECDDVRSSPAYMLRDMAIEAGATVLCTDPYVSDPDLVPLDEVLRKSDILVRGCPHKLYAGLIAEDSL